MAICLRYAGDRFEATGIMNEGFFKVFNNIDRYSPDKPFVAWLRRIITNTAIDHYRKSVRFLDHLDIADHDHIPQISSVYDDMAYDDLLKLVQLLTPAYRAVFNLFAIDGYSHEEIAEMLGISVGTSKSNLFKARQKLQELLMATDDYNVYNIKAVNKVQVVKLITNNP
ncbi:MAG: RNA polymerase sigma factor [Flavobacterium sp.]|nr:MAG: RNA polymerase sigma factor [Flavobacterium sp.]